MRPMEVRTPTAAPEESGIRHRVHRSRRRLIAITVLSLLLVACISTVATADTYVPPVPVAPAITGQVTDTATGEPIPGITVRAYLDTHGDGSYWSLMGLAYTDIYGQYDLSSLEEVGEFYVSFYDSTGEYARQYYSGQSTRGLADRISVGSDEIVPGIDAAMVAASSLSGLVTEADSGEPIPGIQVRVYSDYLGDGSTWWLESQSYTDGYGEYQTGSLAAGTYVVRFSDEGNHFQQQYFSGETVEGSAERIPLGTGEALTGIDASLVSVPSSGYGLGKITGHAVDAATSSPVPDCRVTIYRHVGSEYYYAGQAVTDTSGEYSIANVSWGDNVVLFSPDLGSDYAAQLYSGKAMGESPDTVTLGPDSPSASGIDAALILKNSHITGTVFDQLGNPYSCPVTIYLQSPWGYEYAGSLWSDGDGLYDASLGAGAYKVYAYDLMGGGQAYYSGKHSLGAADIVTLGENETVSGIDMSFQGVASPAAIKGTVVDSATGEPIAGVTVTASADSDGNSWPDLQYEVYTDFYGQYTIAISDPQGLDLDYRVLFRDGSSGYAPQVYNGHALPNDVNWWDIGDAVYVAAGATVSGVNAALDSGDASLAAITGTVTESGTGEPIAGVEVSAYADSNGDSWPDQQYETWTDSYGQYTIAINESRGLDLNYRVLFRDGSSGYAPQVYNGKAVDYDTFWWAIGDAVYVGAGDTASGVDAALDAYAHITGHVTDEDTGEPLPGAGVVAYLSDGSSWNYIDETETDVYGEYSFDEFSPGMYTVGFRSPNALYMWQFYDGKTSQSEADAIELESGETASGIDGTVATGAHISGRVTDAATGDGVDQAWVEVYTSDGSEWYWFASEATGTDGGYDVKGLPAGTYVVAVYYERWDGQSSGHYIGAVRYYDGADSIVSADPVAVAGGEIKSGIDFALDLWPSRVSGTVTDAATGEPLPGIAVDILPEDSYYGAHGYTDIYGRYQLFVLPGTYTVEFRDYEGSYQQQYYNGRMTKGSADPLTVVEGEDLAGIDAALFAGASITGKITDAATGAPLYSAEAAAYRDAGYGWEIAAYGWMEPPWWIFGGSYSINDLAPGDYIVGFDTYDGSHLAEYYDAKTNQGSADVIALGSGWTASGIDADLETASHITGTLTDEATGDPLGNVVALAYVESGAGWELVGTSWPTDDYDPDTAGEYDIGGLVAGTYRVGYRVGSGYGFAEYYSDKSTVEEAGDISVEASGEVSDIDAVLAITPRVDSIDASRGPTSGGTEVIITGIGFKQTSVVNFGSKKATSFTVDSPTQITATAPPQVAGTVRVRVAGPFGSTADTAADDYTYFEQSSLQETPTAGLRYKGPWQALANSLCSGGNYRLLNAAGSAEVVFEGTSLALIATTRGDYGIASVSVDGGAPEPVDLWSSATLYQQEVWDTGTLPDGLHTVRISWTGTRNAKSSANKVAIDAFVIEGTLAPTVQEEAPTPGLDYKGAWLSGANAGCSGGAYKYIREAGYVEVIFEGSYVGWLATTRPDFGIASVSLDGGAPTQVDLYSPTAQYQQLAYSSGLLSAGTHTLRIAWTGNKNPSSSSTYVAIDAFDMVGSLAALRQGEANVPGLNYTGRWLQVPNTLCSNGTYAFINADGAVEVAFEGAYIGLVTSTRDDYGIASVSLDGGAPVPVDLYSPTALYDQLVYSSGVLAEGTHTLRIEWTGDKNPSSKGTKLIVDGFDMAGTITALRTEEDRSPSMHYLGNWGAISKDGYSGGTYSYTYSPGHAEVVFDGTYVAWITSTNYTYGIAEVSIDGGAPEPVDLYTPATLYQQRVWSSGPLAQGTHTLRISYTGDKNPASTNTYVVVDAFDVVGELTAASYEQEPSQNLHYRGAWQTLANLSAFGGSYRLLNEPGYAEVAFEGTYAAWMGITRPDYGIAQVSVDGGPAELVDLYSASTLYKQQLWSSGPLPEGTHTVRITWTGTKNPSATGNKVPLDSLEVVGTLAATRAEEDAGSGLTYSGSWSPAINASCSAGTYRLMNSSGYVEVSFTGSYLGWLAVTRPDYGIAQVSVDGGPLEPVDLYSAAARYQQEVWSTGTLADGPHTVRISWTGTKNPSATNTRISVDALDVVGSF